MAARAETARTRNLNACIRCRFQRVRCVPDPDDEHGPCLTCKRIKRPTLSSLPCLRYIITDSLLYREQSAPYQLFSKRWQTMDLVDITEWASEETKTIELTQVFLHAPFKLEVREFVPKEGDMLFELWQDGDTTHTHPIPPYAMVSLQKTTEMYREFIDKKIATYINGAINPLDDFFFQTYIQAFKHRLETKVSFFDELQRVIQLTYSSSDPKGGKAHI
jgi:hypothetical protein